ncbi:MAG TPA: efflux RND transporter periplasmic adaptor subunit [Gemmatimonadaceae bacterium]|nr:efflux RND transporter periplasmic adaptor subunit [Gemmatimonadaceae bacterium]
MDGSNRIMRQARYTSALLLHFAYFALLLAALPACTRSTLREPEAAQSVPVIAEPVRLGTIRGTVSATGVVTTLAGATVNVSAHQPARIAEITKKAGDPVKSGELLVRFEFPSLGPQVAVNAAAVKAAERRLQRARLAQSRISSLVSRGAASRREMEDANREAAVAEGELSAANAAMHATVSAGQNADVRAPFNGTVVERLHDPGDLVRAGDEDPILRLIDPTQVQVTATVARADLTRFSIGATARAVADLRRPQGTVSQPAGDSRATTVLLRIVSRPEPEPGDTTAPVTLAFDLPTDLVPGTQVGIEIDAEQRSNVPLVPAIAVLGADDARYVMIATGDIAQRRPVVTGLTDSEHIEIQSGVKAGELIITQGHSSLRDETPISVSPP